MDESLQGLSTPQGLNVAQTRQRRLEIWLPLVIIAVDQLTKLLIRTTLPLHSEVPIVPGIMPISNFTQLKRFSESCGAEIPRWIGQRMRAYGDDAESLREFASDFVAQLCERLIAGGAPGLHFYTLNLAKPTLNVLARIA